MAKGVRTFQPNRRHRKRTHGFLVRMATKKGRQVLAAPPRQGAQAPRCHRTPDRLDGAMPSNALPPARRIRRRGEFQRVFDAGRRAHGRYLTIIAAPRSGADSRLGIVASKKLGGAVVRNRAKRLIREMFRTQSRPESRPRIWSSFPKRESRRCKLEAD